MRSRGITESLKLTNTEAMAYAPSWFHIISSQWVRKPHSVSTRMLVEDEQGIRYAKASVASVTLARLRTMLPMGVSPMMPVYLQFIKAVNRKRYSVYACYNQKVRFPLFYIKDISGLGVLHKLKEN